VWCGVPSGLCAKEQGIGSKHLLLRQGVNNCLTSTCSSSDVDLDGASANAGTFSSRL